MFRSTSDPTNFQLSLNCPRLPNLLSVNFVPSALKSNFQPCSVVPARAKQPNPFGIHISTRHLKSFRIRIYEKRGRGGPPACANPAIAGTIRVLNPISKEGA